MGAIQNAIGGVAGAVGVATVAKKKKEEAAEKAKETAAKEAEKEAKAAADAANREARLKLAQEREARLSGREKRLQEKRDSKAKAGEMFNAEKMETAQRTVLNQGKIKKLIKQKIKERFQKTRTINITLKGGK